MLRAHKNWSITDTFCNVRSSEMAWFTLMSIRHETSASLFHSLQVKFTLARLHAG